MVKKNHSRLAILVLLSFTLISFQNCTEFEANNFSSSTPVLNNSQNFAAAKLILQTNCSSCHGANSPDGSVVLTNEVDFVRAGWIIPQNPNSSKLITRLKNYPNKNGTQNMPRGSLVLSDTDYQTLFNWVLNIPADTANLNCGPNESIQEAKIKRLTKRQFENSMTNAFGNIFASTDFPNFRDDNPRIGLANNPDLLEMNEVNLLSLYDSSQLLSTKIIAQINGISNCISQGSGNTCFIDIINNYGRKLWRRPVETQEVNAIVAELTKIANAGLSRTAQGEFVLKAMILSANHLFRTEIGTIPANGVFQLSQYEIASLLSFAAWDSPPDDILLNLASQNRLHDSAILNQQVVRLTQNSKFINQLTGFIIDLLKIEDIHTIVKDSSFAITASERQALYTSAERSIFESYSATGTDLFTPFKMNRFYLNSQINRFIPGSANTQFAPMTLNTNERYGILSHPAFLTSIAGQVSSGIVRRGVFALEQLLCDHMPPPPANVTSDPMLPEGFNPETSSSRDVLTVTHSARSDCMGCHFKIDPAGFAFESFDTFGRFRTFEKGNIPINSSGILEGIDISPIIFDNSVGFLREIEQSPSFRTCITKKYFQYSTGFNGSGRAQQCENETYLNSVRSKPQELRSLLEALIELPSFTRRVPASTNR